MNSYRSEIDGLRGLAVAAVLLFHANSEWLSGGFVGVDVFFVISGYLITHILVRDLEAKDFSLTRFFSRRIKRLLPALLVVVLFSTIGAYILLFPDDFISFGKSVLGTTFYSSNIVFWREAGYFTGPSHFKPLLHTWSLSIEEQFYLLYPLFLVLLFKLPTRWRGLMFIGCFFASLFLSVLFQETRPSVNFFLLPSRAWELMLGGVLAMSFFKIQRPPSGAFAIASSQRQWSIRVFDFVGAAGFLMVLFAMVTYDESTVFPGFTALLPCMGTAMILWSTQNHSTSIMTRVFSFKPLAFLGLISYSLYLWHWPIFSFYRYYQVEAAKPLMSLCLIAASVIFATLSWRFVERPLRYGLLPAKFIFAYSILLGLAIGGSTILANGHPYRFAPSVLNLLEAKNKFNPRQSECLNPSLQNIERGRLCRLGPAKAAPEFLVWGDSHANSMQPIFDRLAEESGRSGVIMARDGCPPLLNVDRKNYSVKCSEYAAATANYLRENKIKTVYLVGYWVGYTTTAKLTVAGIEKGLVDTVSALARQGVKVHVVGPIPGANSPVPLALAREAQSHLRLPGVIGRNQFETMHKDVVRGLAAAERAGARVILPHLNLCAKGEHADCIITHKGEPLYVDAHHLSLAGAQFLLPFIRENF